ncbi:MULTISPECIES: glycosyltransferase family 2 protein [Sphingobacterium]|uniref:Glycosyltransferase family 2 protein n=1 Tax=Sphingobacterium populi TaxID=1812824 RepID=A0ABW5UBQ9_9SPHI|nr:glycosyltransferase family 2 protein [Sphingobacterium sp. CFCC 11742]
MKLISFVLPAYKATYLEQAISSILHQSYENWELIVVDDTSPENLKVIVDSFEDSRIKYYRNTKNIGGTDLVKQWNHSITFAQGEYIVLAADDDIYHPNFLQTMVDLSVKYPAVDIVRAKTSIINEHNEVSITDETISEYCSKHEFLYHWLRATIFTCIGNYMFKTTVLNSKGFINFPSAFCSDAATAIMMAENGIANTDKALFSFRISDIHLSSDRSQLDNKLLATTKFYRWLLALNYEKPVEERDQFFFYENNSKYIQKKCLYDYYNQVIKYLPWYKFWKIGQCELLSIRDKCITLGRFFYNKVFRR